MAKRKPVDEPQALAPTAGVTMRQALTDPELLGTVLEGDSWKAWRILLVAAWGEQLDAEEREVFKTLTGRSQEPGERLEELWCVIGRRGGKSRAIAVLIVFIATLVDHSSRIVPGERPVVLCLAPTARQARVVLDYVTGIIESTPLLAPLIANKTNESLELSNGITIEVRPATFRGTRGFTTVAVVADEIAFWRSDESANPDAEILKALRPSRATTGGPLIAMSSPHAKRGELYSTFKRHFGPDGHPLILVAKAPSLTMNPSLSQRVVDRAYEEDPEAASAEYGAEFRGDISIFIGRDALEACVTTGVSVRAPLDGVGAKRRSWPSARRRQFCLRDSDGRRIAPWRLSRGTFRDRGTYSMLSRDRWMPGGGGRRRGRSRGCRLRHTTPRVRVRRGGVAPALRQRPRAIQNSSALRRSRGLPDDARGQRRKGPARQAARNGAAPSDGVRLQRAREPGQIPPKLVRISGIEDRPSQFRTV